jgi:hypothetical protein
MLTNAPPNFLKKLKCKSESENSKRIKSWGTLLNSQHFGGKRGMLKLQDGD